MNALLWLLAAILGGGAALRLSVPGQYRALYVRYGEAHGIDPNLLHALALQEGGGRETAPTTVSPLNANGTRDYGVMQINDANFPRLGLTVVTAKNAARSVEAAAKLLASQVRAAPQLTAIDHLSIYNAGFSDQDADAAQPGRQLRAKLAPDGRSYFNAAYTNSAFRWWLLVSAASLSPIRPLGWSV